MTPITGLSAFPITPADEHGCVDTGALRVLLKRLTEAKVHSIGLLGSTGSYLYLTRAQRRRTIETAAEHVAGETPLLVGIGALRTDETVLLAQDAKAAGADALLLAPVSYTPLLDEEVYTHFATVAQAVGMPLVIYNNPNTTHFTFSTALVARLSHLPHIVAVKNPAPQGDTLLSTLRDLRAHTQPGFSLGYSVDWRAAEALIAGADAWYSVAAGLFPEPCMRLMRAIQSGDTAEARRVNTELQPLWDVFTAFTSLRVIYAAANILGICRATLPRPILPLPEAAQRNVAEVLHRLALH
jgi:4-hydroxy-tetrahydrodipicolinate synthase